MSIGWVFTIVATILVVLYVLVRIFMDEPAEGHYSIPDLPNEEREAAWDEVASGSTIDDLGDEPIDDLDDSEGGTDDDDMKIDDLPDLS